MVASAIAQNSHCFSINLRFARTYAVASDCIVSGRRAESVKRLRFARTYAVASFNLFYQSKNKVAVRFARTYAVASQTFGVRVKIFLVRFARTYAVASAKSNSFSSNSTLLLADLYKV